MLSNFKIVLPKESRVSDELKRFLGNFGNIDGSELDFEHSNKGFMPKVGVVFEDVANPKAIFIAEEKIEISIENKSNQVVESPEDYIEIELTDFLNRISGIDVGTLDHIGFNLPWFDGVHPDILVLRKKLATKCAYFRFPSGENWDFILPASQEEIENGLVNFDLVRRPKVEIVTFNKSSTPLIQIDFSLKTKYEQLTSLFPEAIADPDLKNIWVYIQNPWNIDMCFVVNEFDEDDWGNYFKGHRLTSNT